MLWYMLLVDGNVGVWYVRCGDGMFFTMDVIIKTHGIILCNLCVCIIGISLVGAVIYF